MKEYEDMKSKMVSSRPSLTKSQGDSFRSSMKRAEPEEGGDDGLAASREEKEYKDFAIVKKNKAAVFANLVTLALKIETSWSDLDQRLRLLKVMRYYLFFFICNLNQIYYLLERALWTSAITKTRRFENSLA